MNMNIEQSIEFDKIKEKWAALAVTEGARQKIREISFSLSELELRKNLRDTGDSRRMMEQYGTPPLVSLEGIEELLSVADRGDCLTPYQLERIEKVLAAVRRLKDYLERGKQTENPLAYYEENLEPAEELRQEIARQIRNGEVDTYASRELARLRGEILRAEEKMKEKAEQVMRANKSCMADSYCTFKNGRLCIPVKKECKLKIAGSVIEKSSTGNTLFMEPAGVAKYDEELQSLRIEEEDEVRRILYTLTALTADNGPAMEENLRMLEKLDFIFSKGKLSMDLGAVEPTLRRDRRIILRQARHPLMDRTENVPLDFSLGEDRDSGNVRGIVITGPNTGGKTVALKTVILNCMMAQCGLHVTCEEAQVCMNSAYLCDIGDNQNLAENLSTFSAHIKNVLEILRTVDRESLVIMDELGSGTDPGEGMGIAIAILEELRKSGCLFLVTTHYPEVKEYAGRTEGIVNARMTFDQETLCPTYRMVIGEAGESCAFSIARRLGMPEEMLDTAKRAAYGEEFYEGGISSQPPKPSKLQRIKSSRPVEELSRKFQIGDSVLVLPDKKIGIVCETVNEKGILRVQLPGRKIWINHKRVRLQVAADRLYPENYDFSILFDTVENRKKRHAMERKYTEDIIEREEGFIL
ncbi:MAG: DNA mismatch repair protein MutS [Roseburia sp.]|nr:DNA mismatch repair protein MutS [Roseburia sp.]